MGGPSLLYICSIRTSLRPLEYSLGRFTGPKVCRRYTTQGPSLMTRLVGTRRQRLLIATGACTVGAVVVAKYTNGPAHAWGTVQRSKRVAITLWVCIQDYRKTLSTRHQEIDPSQALKDCHQRCATRTLKVLEKNGSIFIKLGQHLSSMGYLLPTEWTITFTPLQDKCPVSSVESIEAMILEDTGVISSDIFSYFDPIPIGAASLAQVHRAVLKDTGQEVAVKVQHPALKQWIGIDLALTRFVFRNIRFFFPEYPMEWLSDEMETSLPKEVDFVEEAINIERARRHFENIKDTSLIIPNVIWAKKRILVLEFEKGRRLDDLEYMAEHKISREEVSTALARIFNEMIFGEDAPLHCDPHGGNLAVRYNPERKSKFDIILYDHGLYRDIPKDLRRSYAKLWLAVIDSNEPRMRKYAHEVAGITDQQFPLFASAITGRDFNVLMEAGKVKRSSAEKEQMSAALTGGLLAQLIQLLAQVPPIILLILKTNDLTRSLDESLQTNAGPERSFLILARYCSRTVFREELEQIRSQHLGTLIDFLRLVGAYFSYYKTDCKLALYEFYFKLASKFKSDDHGQQKPSPILEALKAQ